MEKESIPKITERQSAGFYALKGIAILMVVCAHMTASKELDASGEFARNLRSIAGTLGVPCFFFASGFFFRRSPGDSAAFWRKKASTIIVPWLIGATVTFALYSLKDRNAADLAVRFVKWFLGIGSWLYYMSVLLCCFVWFKFVTGRVNIWLTFALTCASLVMTRLGIIPDTEWFTSYVNPFNWLGFFGLGVLARWSERFALFEKKRPALLALGALSLVAGGACRFYFNDFVDASGKSLSGYASFFAIPTELGTLAVALALASLTAKNKLIVDVGKKSFAIYLYHMPFVSVVNLLVPQREPIGILIAPVVALAFVYLAFVVLEFVAKKARCEGALKYLGLR